MLDVRELVKVSKALSDETRIRMLKLLLEKDICLCEMEHIFDLSESQISRSLNMLMNAGFLKRWRDGRCVVYVADRATSNEFCRTFLDLLARSLNDNDDVNKDRKKLQQVIGDQVREKRK